MTFVGLITEDGKKLLLDYPDQFKAYFSQWAGDEVELEIRKKRTKRTLKQNAYLHAAIKPFADHCGYTVEELKLALLGECFGYHQVNGVTLPMKLHTSDLTTQEFVEITELMIQRAAEQSILILYPDEYLKSKRRRRGAADHSSEERQNVRAGGPRDGVQPSPATVGRVA